jgi:hypothetical protein
LNPETAHAALIIETFEIAHAALTIETLKWLMLH